jgi:probable DNA metabolism protein
MVRMATEKELRNMFGLALLHPNYDNKIWQTALKKDRNLLYNLGCEEARKLYSMHKKVAGYIHKKKSFMRFRLSRKEVLYSDIRLEYPIERNLLIHFHKRFPLFYVVIQSGMITWWISPQGSISKKRKGVEKVVKELEKRANNNIVQDMEFDEDWWPEYYASQFIKQRKNLKLMRKQMPKYLLEEGSEEARIYLRSKSLKEFL